MSERARAGAKQTPEIENLQAAVRFVQKLGGVEQAKQALEELKKLQKTG